MKKFFSVMLAAVLLWSALLPAAAAAQEDGAVPTVYILGGNAGLINENGEQVTPIETPDGYVGDAVADCLGDLAKALILRTPEAKQAYSDKLVSWMAPLYEKVVMDNNGDPIGTYYPTVDYSLTPFTIPETAADKISGGEYPLRAYEFYYDWRLDPFVNAGLLADYIDSILRGTGRSKVNLVGRCEGSTILLAYLAEYGHEKVNKIFFNTAACNGYILTSALFGGDVHIASAEARRYLNNNPNFSLDQADVSALPMGTELLTLAVSLLDASAAVPGLDLTGAALGRLYQDLVRDAIADVLLVSYATFPAMWTMIEADKFDAAVDYIFAGREEEYAGLIARIRRYHEEVGLKTEDLLRACEEDGVTVGAVVKYGYPAIPLCEDSDLLSDGHAFVKDVSFGAVTATHTGTLDDKYISARVAEGKGKYISADKKIDASTGLFPDTTWYIGNLEHQYFPYLIDYLNQTFFVTDGMTVDTVPSYPQFMVFNEAYRLDPLTEENAACSTVGADDDTPSLNNSMERFAGAFGNILIRIIEYVSAIIRGIVAHAKGAA